MTPPLYPEAHSASTDSPQAPLPLVTEGVLRYVWESKFGSILIEVIGDEIRVNGKVVEQAV